VHLHFLVGYGLMNVHMHGIALRATREGREKDIVSEGKPP